MGLNLAMTIGSGSVGCLLVLVLIAVVNVHLCQEGAELCTTREEQKATVPDLRVALKSV
jgi:hypothetical protein